MSQPPDILGYLLRFGSNVARTAHVVESIKTLGKLAENEENVEACARALARAQHPRLKWAQLTMAEREEALAGARVVLEAQHAWYKSEIERRLGGALKGRKS